MTDPTAGCAAPRPAGPPVEVPVPVPVEVSVADWTAGYEAGYSAGYHAARTALDDAARALAALRPSRTLDVTAARTPSGRRPGEPDRDDPATVAAYRARIYASWGLPPPGEPACHPSADPELDDRQTA